MCHAERSLRSEASTSGRWPLLRTFNQHGRRALASRASHACATVFGSEGCLADSSLRRLRSRLGPDGLAYWPTKGRSFLTNYAMWMSPVIGDSSQGQFATPCPLGRLIGSMTIYSRTDGNSVWRRSVERMISRLSELVINKEDYAHFPRGCFAPGAKVTSDMPVPDTAWATLPGWLIQGLAQYYRATQYEPARDLAMKLARFTMDHGGIFDAEGRFTGWQHFHHHTAVVVGIADLALATGDRRSRPL